MRFSNRSGALSLVAIILVLIPFILRFGISLSSPLYVIYDILYIFIIVYPVVFIRFIKGNIKREIIVLIAVLSVSLYILHVSLLLNSGQPINNFSLLAFDTILYAIMLFFILFAASFLSTLLKRKYGKLIGKACYITVIIGALLLFILSWIDARYFLILILLYYFFSLFYNIFNAEKDISEALRGRIILEHLAPLLVLLIISGMAYGVAMYKLSYSTDPREKTDLITEMLTHNRWCYMENNCLFKRIGQATDLFTWLMLGYSRCGGVAHISTDLLNQYGVEAYYAGFPGEDHFFVVVNISGRLYVIDPGLYSKTVTMEERIIDRLKNWGGISYIAIYRGNDVIELTDKYPGILSYDTIIIQILNNGKSVPNACVTLKHKFQTYKVTEIPGNGYCLYTNSRGEVVIHLGVPYYIEKAQYYEPFFHVYVDGKDTGITVTSTGTNTTHYIVVTYPSK